MLSKLARLLGDLLIHGRSADGRVCRPIGINSRPLLLVSAGLACVEVPGRADRDGRLEGRPGNSRPEDTARGSEHWSSSTVLPLLRRTTQVICQDHRPS